MADFFSNGYGSGLIGGALGMIGGSIQYRRQKKLMAQQYEYALGMAQQNQEYAKEMAGINSTILELIRSTYHTENEFRKADFYKTEFDHFCDFLKHFDVLSSTKLTEDVMDEFGKMHKHTLSEQRSLVKSIPEVRALMQGA